ncbi:uncharacterized protein BO66DRAFT_225563 [Aspergillus aculeatinus CBS 121060]|uniref:Uncharacterized protein n=1 Tax=Aspergillus aculeatinus CBS 121060 TaxID=1448322 RepID=A0ACD1HJ95_9EURO|nr:hypothetical protein BO66DRAFT_225563 [Aspergillus aculeatinus CBS 121060]RAH73547.1 hypothetical protein BO66DRAFT_225563 [Aspergillus aculeatinus CBS 121060]
MVVSSTSGDKPPLSPKPPPLPPLRSTKHTSSFQSSVPVHRTGSSACNPLTRRFQMGLRHLLLSSTGNR